MRASSCPSSSYECALTRGVILAGGGATRYGGAPKGLAMVGGRRILDRLVDECVAAFGELPLLVANAPDAAMWHPGLQVTADIRPGTGALGGLYTAVVQGPAPVVVVAWDMPFVTAPLLRALADALASNDCALPSSTSPHGLEPMCAAYGPACAEPMRDALDAGDLRAVAFHPRVKVGILSTTGVSTFGDPAVLFSNVNSPDDLVTAESTWQRLTSSQSSAGRTPERPR